eukprot:Nk52_evm8s151 gene=Nk52_evmTU8s151
MISTRGWQGQLGTTIVNIIRNALKEYKDIDKTGSFYNTDIFYQKIAEEASKTFGASVAGPSNKSNRRGDPGKIWDDFKELTDNMMDRWILSAVISQTVYSILGVAFNVWYQKKIINRPEFREERVTFEAMRQMRDTIKSLGFRGTRLLDPNLTWLAEIPPNDFMADSIYVHNTVYDVKTGDVMLAKWSPNGEMYFDVRGMRMWNAEGIELELPFQQVRDDALARYGSTREGLFNDYFLRQNDPGALELWDSGFDKRSLISSNIRSMGQGLWRYFDRGIPGAYMEALKGKMMLQIGNPRAIDRMSNSLPRDVRQKLIDKLVEKGMDAEDAKLEVERVLGKSLGAIDEEEIRGWEMFRKKLGAYQEGFSTDMDRFAKAIGGMLLDRPDLYDFKDIYTQMIRYHIGQNQYMQGIIDAYNKDGIGAFEHFRSEYMSLVEQRGAELGLDPNEIQSVMTSINEIPSQQKTVSVDDFLAPNFEDSAPKRLLEDVCEDRISGAIKVQLGQGVDYMDGFRRVQVEFHYNEQGVCDRFDIVRFWPPPFEGREFSRETRRAEANVGNKDNSIQGQISDLAKTFFPIERRVDATVREVQKLAEYGIADPDSMFAQNDIRSLNPQDPLQRRQAVMEFKVAGAGTNYEFNMDETFYQTIQSEMSLNLGANALNSAFVLGSVASMGAITDKMCSKWGENVSHKVLCVLSGVYDVLGIAVSSVVTIRSIYTRRTIKRNIYDGDMQDFPKPELSDVRLRDDGTSVRRLAFPNENTEYPDASFDAFRAREAKITTAYSVFAAGMVFLDLGVSIYSLVELLKKQSKYDNANAAQSRKSYAVVTQSTLQAQNLMVQINKAGGVQYFKLKSFYRQNNCGGNQN